MCGIAGFVDKKQKLNETQRERYARAMLSKIAHRGNDSQEVTVDGAVAFAHARLSIVDLSASGKQPMRSSETGSFIVYNGELYNHLDIREQLGEAESFKSRSDTETLLRAFDRWSVDSLRRTKGMFAFAIYNKAKEELVLAVDKFAIKPLYYIDTPDWFAFASEAKALFVLPGVDPALNDEVLLEQVMFRYLAGPRTLFQGVKKLTPADIVHVDLIDGAIKNWRYWKPKHRATSMRPLDELDTLLNTSVAEHLLADVPIGLQLSGGVDSSLVSALTRAKVPKDQQLHSFSIGLADEGWNEFYYSRIMAAKLNTAHHEIVFTEEDFVRALPDATYHLDEPVGHSHTVPMMLLAREAAKHVKVLMSGEGADEVFGGYRRYAEIARKRNPSPADIMLSHSFVSEQEAKSVLKVGVKHPFDERERLVPDSGSTLSKLCTYDLSTYLSSLLVRQDKMGMSATLENRVPFLDHELVEFGLSLNDDLKIHDNEGKHILKQVAERYIPSEIIYRPKVGFGQPISSWLRNPKGLGRYLTLLDALDPSLFAQDHIRYLKQSHLEGGTDNSAILWNLIAFAIWERIFIRGDQEDIYLVRPG